MGVVRTPDVAALGLDANPSRSPLDYPGRLVREPALLVGGWLYRTDGTDVLADGGPLGTGRRPLDEALAALGRTGTADRRPVLATGSNASPGQLRFKFAGEPVVPMTPLLVEGLAVGHSAHVSRAGYVPWAPLVRPGHRLAALVLWLDAEQVVVLDRTEPNYHRVPLPPSAGVVGGPPGCDLYRGRWGLLRAGPDAPPLAATSQEAVLATLLRRPWFAGVAGTTDPAAAADRLAADPEARDRVRRLLAEHGHAGPDGFDQQ